MGKAIWSANGLTRGNALLGKWGDDRATVREAVSDGDTTLVEADGNLSVRFLGIDTPEKKFFLPGTTVFKRIDPHFRDYLTNPFSDVYSDSATFSRDLGAGLVEYLRQKLGPNCAENHFYHAEVAEDELEKYIQRDVDAVGSLGGYRFFMAFAYEIMDRYGRFLCYLHQHLPPDQREGRISYNEEMLESGMALPYFIFPNINPFRRSTSILDAIPETRDFRNYVQGDNRLAQARDFVRTARRQHLGVFDDGNPLSLDPFELRFLGRREAPSRWVIDMTARRPVLLKPTDYYEVPNPEDRLFINSEHVPLFRERGYHVRS